MFRKRRVLFRAILSSNSEALSKEQAAALFSLTVHGLRECTAFRERESRNGILGTKTASEGLRSSTALRNTGTPTTAP